MRLTLLSLSVLCAPFLAAQQDGPAHPFQDSLVAQLAGEWSMTGELRGQPQHYTLKAEWVLNHQFLRFTEKTSAQAPAGEHPYDSVWYLGYDTISDRYVLHLMDTFGGRFSETLGFGTRDGNQIKFVFEYPDGPFHTTYVWNSKENTWQC